MKQNNAPDFIQIPNQVFMDRELSGTDMLVYGLVYWYTKLKNEKCYASNQTFADILGVRSNKISESLGRLQKSGYIKMRYSDDAKRNREEIIPLVVYRTILQEENRDTPNGVTNDTPNGVQNKNNIIRRVTNTSKPEVLRGKQWNELIDLFKPVNPMFEGFYKNTTERKALELLVTKIGFEKTKAVIEHLPEITRIKYAPKITSPTELKRDLGKLITFYKQQSNNKVGIIL